MVNFNTFHLKIGSLRALTITVSHYRSVANGTGKTLMAAPFYTSSIALRSDEGPLFENFNPLPHMTSHEFALNLHGETQEKAITPRLRLCLLVHSSVFGLADSPL